MTPMGIFFAGIFVGVFVGIFVIGMCAAAARR